MFSFGKSRAQKCDTVAAARLRRRGALAVGPRARPPRAHARSRPVRREEQIQSISQFNPMARCTSPDRNTWDIGLKLPNGQVVTLRLFVARLPPLHYATLRLSSQASPRIRARIMSSRFPDVAPHLQVREQPAAARKRLRH